MTVIYAYLKD